MQIRDFDGEVDAHRFGDKPVGFFVDKIGDVIAVDENEVEPPPPHLEETSARYVEGVIRLDEKLLLVLGAGEML